MALHCWLAQAAPSPLSPSCTQYDVHLPLLTVRETLAFARDALWAAGTKNDLAAEFHQVLEAEASEVGSAVLVSFLQAGLLHSGGHDIPCGACNSLKRALQSAHHRCDLPARAAEGPSTH